MQIEDKDKDTDRATAAAASFPLLCPVLVLVVVTYFIATLNKREGGREVVLRERERARESDRIE